LFTKYMYFERAKLGIKSSTTEALRNFYEKNKYEILHKNETLEDLITLCDFWESINRQDGDRFSEKVLKSLFILNYAPNGMWSYFLSVYFMANKDEEGNLDNEDLYTFLTKTIYFIWAYSILRPGVNALRTPIYTEMINIVNHQPVTFEGTKFDVEQITNAFNNFDFYNGRPVTKSMIVWWTFQQEKQALLSLETKFDIEHIYAKNRQIQEKGLKDPRNLESLGNKALLERRINIRVSDYRFEDKKKYYNGKVTDKNGKSKQGTEIVEILELAENKDFVEDDIINRKKKIIESFIEGLKKYNLIC